MSKKCPIDYKIPDKPIGYDEDKIRYGELGYGVITKNIPVKEVEVGEVYPLDIYIDVLRNLRNYIKRE